MDLTFLGHQSWLVSENNSHILIDPVLSDKFGHDTIHGIEIYPPRSIDIAKMPKIDAIILSHEHSDHFHLPSLLAFKNTPIYVGKLMPACVTELLHKANMKTIEIDYQQSFRIGDIEITFYPPDERTVFWESRVTQIHLHSLKHLGASAFVAVDALVSSKFKDDVTDELIAQPTAIIVSNNSQIPPNEVAGSLDNYVADSVPVSKGIVGLQILTEMLINYLSDIEEINNIVICGGGFMKIYDTFFGPFQFSDQDELASIAQALSTGKKIFGPLPGDIITIENAVSMSKKSNFVDLDKLRLYELKNISKAFKLNTKAVPIKPLLGEFNNQNEFKNAKILVEKELVSLARALMLSPIGEAAINTHESENITYSEHRLLIRFLSGNQQNNLTYVLDFNSGKFVLNNHADDSVIPFGIELYLKDFCAVLNGEIQIWDLAGIAMRSWYVGTSLESPIGFLYTWYGEQVQVKNNYHCYLNRWSNLFNNDVAGEIRV